MTDDLMKALEETVAELKQFQTLVQVTSEAAEATDDSGTVTVSVDDKQRLTQIRVATKWQDKLEPDALAGAVQRALGHAMAASFGGAEDESKHDVDLSQKPEVTPEDRQAAQAVVDEQAEMLRRTAATRTAEDMVEEIHQLGDRADAQEQDRQATPSQHEYFSANKRASLVYDAGFCVEVRLDKHWVRTQSGSALTATFNEILEQAADERNELTEALASLGDFTI